MRGGDKVGAWEVAFDFPNLRRNADAALGPMSRFISSNFPSVAINDVKNALSNLSTDSDRLFYLNHLDEVSLGNRNWGHVDFDDGPFNGNANSTFFTPRVSNGTNPQVGVVSLIPNNMIEFHINIPPNLQQQQLGTYLIKQSIIDYAPSKVKGWWKTSDIYSGGESINLTIFRQKIAEGFTPTQAAMETPTGRIMQNNGFGGVPEVITNTPGEVIIHFNPR